MINQQVIRFSVNKLWQDKTYMQVKTGYDAPKDNFHSTSIILLNIDATLWSNISTYLYIYYSWLLNEYEL